MMNLIKWLKAEHNKGECFIIGGVFNDTLGTKTKLIKLCTDKVLQVGDMLQSK